MTSLSINSFLLIAKRCGGFLRGRHRTFVIAENSDRRRELDAAWARSFANCSPNIAMRLQLPDRWARFHIRGHRDSASDNEAVIVLQGLLDDLRGDLDEPLRLIVTEYNSGDSYGGWSKSLAVTLFAWRRVWRRPPVFFWASDPTGEPIPLEQVLMMGVKDGGESIITDQLVRWAFCPYYAGVDVIFATSAERDEFVAAHMSLRPNNAMGL